MPPGEPNIPTFHALDWFNIYGRGRIAVVKLDRDSTDFAHLIRQNVSIDGVFYRCLAVEQHPIAAHFYVGQPTGLMVERLEERCAVAALPC